MTAAPLVIPTNYTPGDKRASRPIISVQMLKPNGTWSSPIKFNFDTGASSPTDVPLQILSDFGGQVSTSGRKAQPGKIKIPGFNGDRVLDLPVMVQDKAHYDLFREQSTRYPLMRVYDLMQYMSIIFELNQTTLRPVELGQPAELSMEGIMTMPPAQKRSGTPTSAHYWTKGTMTGSKTYSDVWLNVCTGDYRFIIPRSFCDKAGFKITSDNISGNGESNATGTFRWDETKPVPLILDNITVTARDDDADYARGGVPRCLMGGPNFLSKYKIVIWENHMAFVPLSGTTPPPDIPPVVTPPPVTEEPADRGIEKSGYSKDVSKWTAVNMRDDPGKGKIIDKNRRNVRTDFQSKENAQLWLDWKKSTITP